MTALVSILDQRIFPHGDVDLALKPELVRYLDKLETMSRSSPTQTTASFLEPHSKNAVETVQSRKMEGFEKYEYFDHTFLARYERNTPLRIFVGILLLVLAGVGCLSCFWTWVTFIIPLEVQVDKALLYHRAWVELL